MPYPGTRRGDRAGSYFPCAICAKQFYRLPSQIARGATKTCSKKCLAVYFSKKGAHNPFYGKTHSEHTKLKISQARTGQGMGNQHAKGYRHTAEEKAKISSALRQRWQLHRQTMLSHLPRGLAHFWNKPPELRRYRKEWTPLQRREWTASACIWCGAIDHLILDHIVPIFMGGAPIQANAQTLCMTCNHWKLWFIERPIYFSLQAAQGTN